MMSCEKYDVDWHFMNVTHSECFEVYNDDRALMSDGGFFTLAAPKMTDTKTGTILPSIASQFGSGSDWTTKNCVICSHKIYFNFGTGKEFLSVTDPTKKFTEPFLVLPAFSPTVKKEKEKEEEKGTHEELFACPGVRIMSDEFKAGLKPIAEGRLSLVRDSGVVKVLCDDKLITVVKENPQGKTTRPKTVQFLGNEPQLKIFIAVFQSDMTGSLFLAKLNNALLG